MTKNRICDFFAVALLIMTVATATTMAQAQIFSVLYNLGTNSGDPCQPGNESGNGEGVIAQGRDGNLYSTAPTCGANDFGGVFKITPTGTFTLLYSFDAGHGIPFGGLTLGSDGNFYGTSDGGGTSGDGTIFKITPAGSITTLYSFTGFSDGYQPLGPPLQGIDGNFYGTAKIGGNYTACGNGCGTLYKITPSGTFTTLYQFDLTHGDQPNAPLVQGTDGNFYGTTFYGGTSGGFGSGVVFKITSAGKLTVLYNFCSQAGCTDGQYPVGPLVQGSDGNFFGTTLIGGTNGDGVVFKITPAGSLTVLHSMSAATDGYNPNAGLVQATDSSFYGANTYGGSLGYGAIFKITPKGVFSVLYNFDSTTGANPHYTPFQHTNGVVYGDTELGGTGNQVNCSTGNCGVFYGWNASLPPFVSLLPYSGKVGKTIEFLGQGFTSTTTVSFNGTPATPSVKSSTYLTAVVPSGATTGFVTVTTSSGTPKSNKKFRVTPQITSFSPASGPVGTVVTITGVSLTQTTTVTFGGVKATSFTVNSDTQVMATVPTGAKTGHIAITTAGGSATSTGTFTVTL